MPLVSVSGHGVINTVVFMNAGYVPNPPVYIYQAHNDLLRKNSQDRALAWKSGTFANSSQRYVVQSRHVPIIVHVGILRVGLNEAC